MSYHILYRSQFVKVGENQVIPMVEGGDNNVWECDNKRRAREWYAHSIDGNALLTNDELLKSIDQYRNSLVEQYAERENGYEDKTFGWFSGLAMFGKSTGKVTFTMYRNFYTKGIERAKTIEELREHGVSLSFEPSHYSREEIKVAGLEYRLIAPTTTQELITQYTELKEYYKDVKCPIYARYFGIEGYMNEVERERKYEHRKVVSNMVSVEVKEYYIFRNLIHPERIFAKYTKWGYSYNTDINYNNKGFITEKEANAYHKTMRTSGDWTVEKVTRTRSFKVTAKVAAKMPQAV